MKIRSGFVSNSSSSSFVIAFTEKMLTEEIKEKAILEYKDRYSDYYFKDFEEDYEKDEEDEEDEKNEEDEEDEEEVSDKLFKKAIDMVCNDNIIVEDESNSKIEALACSICISLLKTHKIAEINGGPDDQISYVNVLSKTNVSKIEELLK
jgi:hypothetical protein